MQDNRYDVVVIGGGPAGATAAASLAQKGLRTLLVDREGRTKPCGGAIPSLAVREFGLPEHLVKARISGARIAAPSGRKISMEIGTQGYVGMVDRDEFDPWLRERARKAGAERITGTFRSGSEGPDRLLTLVIEPKGMAPVEVVTSMLIGADGASSMVRKTFFGKATAPRYVFAYHEIIDVPGEEAGDAYRADRCEVVYDGRISPDFYGWIFPHGDKASVGTGTAVKSHDLKAATALLRAENGLSHCRTIRREGAPLPLKPMKRWDNGRNVLLAGDAAGVVAPSSGEGIYYAMLCGRLCADAAIEKLRTGRAAHLAAPRKRFMADHGRAFMVLGLLQYFWYGSDKRREQFVAMCADPDVQRLTWESYLNKKLVRRDPLAHLRVLAKDIGQLLGFGPRPA